MAEQDKSKVKAVASVKVRALHQIVRDGETIKAGEKFDITEQEQYDELLAKGAIEELEVEAPAQDDGL